MFCNQCGTKLPDNSKFCGVCGAKQDPIPAVETPVKPEVLVENPPVLDIPAPVWNDPVEVEQPAPKSDKLGFLKNLDLKKILIAAGALVVVIAMILGGIAMFANKDSENVFVCYSDGKYKLVTDTKKAETLSIASAKSDSVNYYSVQFSPDGKYIYFFTKNDYGFGTLCRAEYAKLKDGSNKNDKYIENIASNVDSASLAFTEDGDALYINGDETMYCYDGKEVTQLAKRVSYFRVDEDDRVVYSVRDDEGQTSLYGLKLKKPEEKTKLASNYYEIHLGDDFDNILYTKQEEDGTQNLYKTNFEAKEEKLGENARIIYGDEKVYLTIGTGEKLSMYQFVNDPNAAAEANITEPLEENFYVPYYEYPMVSGSNEKESNYPELYTSCTNSLYWYGERTYRCYSMESALDMGWGDNTVQIHEATRNFINQFAASADEDGYIKVTPEVKAGLQAINAANGGEDWQWLWLCYAKVESGTTFDYDAWSVAYDQWLEVSDRVYLRTELQNPENDVAVKNLCVFEDGKLSVVANNVVRTRMFGGALMYNTVDMLTGNRIPIEEIYSIYDVSNLLDVDMAEQNYFVNLNDDSEGQMTEAVLQAYEEVNEHGDATLQFTEANVYLHNQSGYLAEASYKNGEIGQFNMITDDAGNYAINNDMLIYAAGVYSSNGTTYCDVYEYKDGKSSMLAREVMYDAIRYYEDGQLVVYTDYSYGSGYEMGMVNKKGDLSLVADGVTSVNRADKNLMLFIADEDLYSYDGKNKKMICSDVERVWLKNQMLVEASIYD